MGIVAVAAASAGAAGALLLKMKGGRRTGGPTQHGRGADMWARPGMSVTFRAELKPGRDAAERTFRVARLLPNGRIVVEGIAGEHAENEFERIR